MMKHLLIIFLIVTSFNLLAQENKDGSGGPANVQSSSNPIPPPRPTVPCCAKCAGGNALLNPSVLDTSTRPFSCRPAQEGNGANSGFILIDVPVPPGCVHKVIPNHKKCVGQ